MSFIKPETREDDDEADRQLILLAIAELALRRPGWEWTLRRLAARLDGGALRDSIQMFDAFKKTSADIALPVGSHARLKKKSGR